MNCIAPGPIETEVDKDLEEKNILFCLSGGFWQTWPHWRSCQDNDGSDSRGLVFEFVKREWHCVHGQGRLGEIEEIANLATYLCSDYARWPNTNQFELFLPDNMPTAGLMRKLWRLTGENSACWLGSSTSWERFWLWLVGLWICLLGDTWTMGHDGANDQINKQEIQVKDVAFSLISILKVVCHNYVV